MRIFWLLLRSPCSLFDETHQLGDRNYAKYFEKKSTCGEKDLITFVQNYVDNRAENITNLELRQQR